MLIHQYNLNQNPDDIIVRASTTRKPENRGASIFSTKIQTGTSMNQLYIICQNHTLIPLAKLFYV